MVGRVGGLGRMTRLLWFQILLAVLNIRMKCVIVVACNCQQFLGWFTWRALLLCDRWALLVCHDASELVVEGRTPFSHTVESPASSSSSSSPTLVPRISSLLQRSRVQRQLITVKQTRFQKRALVRCTWFWRMVLGDIRRDRGTESGHAWRTRTIGKWMRLQPWLSGHLTTPSDRRSAVTVIHRAYSQRLSAWVLFRKHLMTCSSK